MPCVVSEANDAVAKNRVDALLSLCEVWAKVQPCVADILAFVVDGQPLKSVCSMPSMPSFLAVHRCLVEPTDDGDMLDFRCRYDVARAALAHNAVDQMIEIADRPITSHTDALKQGQQIRARQFVAERLAPKSYAPARREFQSKLSPTDLADALEGAADIIQQRRNQRLEATANAASTPALSADPAASQ